MSKRSYFLVQAGKITLGPRDIPDAGTKPNEACFLPSGLWALSNSALAAQGWLPMTEESPCCAPGETHDGMVVEINATSVAIRYPKRAMTADELAQQAATPVSQDPTVLMAIIVDKQAQLDALQAAVDAAGVADQVAAAKLAAPGLKVS